MNNYNLKTPFYCLAPMANITTYPFASQAVDFGADLVWTPMVHCETVIHNPEEAFKIIDFKEIENYIIQIIGSEPEHMAKAVQIIEKKLHPLGFDINFACPDKNIVKSGCGGFLMQDPGRIIEIINAVRKVTKLPISVKTRVGWDNKTDVFDLANLLSGKIDMLTVHGRTVKQGFTGEADWDVLAKLKAAHPKMIIVGSGDVKTWQEAVEVQQKTSVDGVMIGRGALGKPWIFKEIKNSHDEEIELETIKKLSLDLAEKANVIWGEKGITESKKHFAWYFRGFAGAQDYRKALMEAKNIQNVRKILTK